MVWWRSDRTRPNGRYDVELKEGASGGQGKRRKLAVRGVDRRLLPEIEEKKPKEEAGRPEGGERAIARAS